MKYSLFIGAILLALICVVSYQFFKQGREIKDLQQRVVLAGTGYASLVAEWSPIVPEISCNFADSSQNDGGSGILLKRSNGNLYILTNAHVVTDDNGNMARQCTTAFLDASSTTYTTTRAHISTDPNGADASLIELKDDPYLDSLVDTGQRKICLTASAVGDNVLVLGYPAIGSSAGITATEGIVSGDESDDYVISAKIDNGNSGGAAIDVKNDCYFGIPTYTIDGQSASLGRVLKWATMFANDPLRESEARL